MPRAEEKTFTHSFDRYRWFRLFIIIIVGVGIWLGRAPAAALYIV